MIIVDDITIVIEIIIKCSTSGLTNVMWGHRRPVACFPFLREQNEDDDGDGDDDDNDDGDGDDDDDNDDDDNKTCQPQ